MARYTGPRLRVVRRLGDLPGLTRKNARRQYPPDNMDKIAVNVLSTLFVWKKSKNFVITTVLVKLN